MKVQGYDPINFSLDLALKVADLGGATCQLFHEVYI